MEHRCARLFRHGRAAAATCAVMGMVGLSIVGAVPRLRATPVRSAVRSNRSIESLSGSTADTVLENPSGNYEDPPLTGPRALLAAADRRQRPYDPSGSTTVDALTTSSREVLENPDGSRTALLSPAPVRYRDDSGDWQPIDLGLQSDGQDRLAPIGAPTDIVIPNDASEAIAVDQVGSGEISLRAPAILGQPGNASVVDGGVAADTVQVIGSSSVESRVTPSPSGFEHDIVFPTQGSSVSSYDLVFDLPDGVTAHETSSGVIFSAANGGQVSSFGGGIAHDAGRVGVRAEVPVATALVSLTARAATVRVTVPEPWLTDPTRQYPVTVDPTYTSIIGQTGGGDTYVNSLTPTTSYASSTELRVGKASDGSVNRSLLKFDVSAIPTNAVVSAASLRLYTLGSASCTASNMDVRSLIRPSAYRQPGLISRLLPPRSLPPRLLPTGQPVALQTGSQST